MTLLEAVILGIIQGLTEFLPISSSGHLVLAQYFMNIHERGFLLEVILHMGTLVAILIYYWNDLRNLGKDAINGVIESRIYVCYLGVATVPTVCVGFLLDEFIKSTFEPNVVIAMLIITALVLATTYFSSNCAVQQFNLSISFCIGLAQACALMPGISRSGITISIALLMGIRHHEAAKFSFLLAIPALLGAGILQMIKIDNSLQIPVFPLIMCFFSAAVAGYLVINWLLSVISQGRFYLFSLYCFSIAIIAHLLIN